MKWCLLAAVILLTVIVLLLLRFFYAGIPYEEWVRLERNQKEG